MKWYTRQRNFEQRWDRGEVQECNSPNIWGMMIPSGGSSQRKALQREGAWNKQFPHSGHSIMMF